MFTPNSEEFWNSSLHSSSPSPLSSSHSFSLILPFLHFPLYPLMFLCLLRPSLYRLLCLWLLFSLFPLLLYLLFIHFFLINFHLHSLFSSSFSFSLFICTIFVVFVFYSFSPLLHLQGQVHQPLLPFVLRAGSGCPHYPAGIARGHHWRRADHSQTAAPTHPGLHPGNTQTHTYKPRRDGVQVNLRGPGDLLEKICSYLMLIICLATPSMQTSRVCKRFTCVFSEKFSCAWNENWGSSELAAPGMSNMSSTDFIPLLFNIWFLISLNKNEVTAVGGEKRWCSI